MVATASIGASLGLLRLRHRTTTRRRGLNRHHAAVLLLLVMEMMVRMLLLLWMVVRMMLLLHHLLMMLLLLLMVMLHLMMHRAWSLQLHIRSAWWWRGRSNHPASGHRRHGICRRRHLLLLHVEGPPLVAGRHIARHRAHRKSVRRRITAHGGVVNNALAGG